MSGLARSARILIARFRDLPARDMIALVAGSLFKLQDILVYSRDLEALTSAPAAGLNGHIQRPGTDFLKGFRQGRDPVEWEFSCDQYDGVKDFFVYEEDGRVGHISWIYYKGDPNRIMDLAPDEAEIKYCLTLNGFRGKGLYPATLKEIQAYLKGKGLKRVFICVENSNAPSRRGIEKAGFELTGRMKLLKVMGIQLTRPFSSRKAAA